jgi:Domain of unknown function (DUF6378)
MNAPDILRAGITAIGDRAVERDQPDGERTAERAARIFNAITLRRDVAALTALDGWLFMCSLKLARAQQGAFKLDDYVDLAAYAALAGECAWEAAEGTPEVVAAYQENIRMGLGAIQAAKTTEAT